MNHNRFQKKLFGAAAMVLAGALAAGATLAQPAAGGPGQFARGIRAAMATLDLTDAQKTRSRRSSPRTRTKGWLSAPRPRRTARP